MMATGSQNDRWTRRGATDIGAERARQGQTTGRVRWVLRISVALAVAALAAVGGWYALHSPASRAPVATAASGPH